MEEVRNVNLLVLRSLSGEKFIEATKIMIFTSSSSIRGEESAVIEVQGSKLGRNDFNDDFRTTNEITSISPGFRSKNNLAVAKFQRL